MPKGLRRTAKPRLLLVFPPSATPAQHREVRRWLTRGGLTAKKLDIKVFTWPEAFEGPAHGPQQIPLYVASADALYERLSDFSPEILVLMSAVMMEGVQTLLHDDTRFQTLMGDARYPMRRLTATRLKTTIDRREKVMLLSFPLPGRATSGVVEPLVEALQTLTHDFRW